MYLIRLTALNLPRQGYLHQKDLPRPSSTPLSQSKTLKMAPSETDVSRSVTHEPIQKEMKNSDSKDHVNDSGSVKVTSAQSMALESQYSAHNYHPLPVVFSRAFGAKVWDPEGKEYLDFLSACTDRSRAKIDVRFCLESGTLPSKDCAGSCRPSQQSDLELTRILQ